MEKTKTHERENHSLQKLIEDVTANKKDVSKRRTKHVSTRLALATPKIYLGIAISVEKLVSVWANAETSEIVPCERDVKKFWDGRCVFVSQGGIEVSSSKTVIPISPFTAALRPTMFTPSIESEEDILRDIVEKEVSKDDWRDVFNTEESRAGAVQFLKNSSPLQSKLQQCLSDCASARKRAAREMVFKVSGFHRLVSRYFSTAQ